MEEVDGLYTLLEKSKCIAYYDTFKRKFVLRD